MFNCRPGDSSLVPALTQPTHVRRGSPLWILFLLLFLNACTQQGSAPQTTERVYPMGDSEWVKEFRALDFPAKYQRLVSFAQNVCLPELVTIVLEYSDPDPNNRVRAFVEWLSQVEASDFQTIESILYEHPHYWYAMIQMAPGDALIDAITVALFAANGELDKAVRWCDALFPFYRLDEDTLRDPASDALQRLAILMAIFRDEVILRVEEGIRLHDRGDYDAAIAVYESVIQVFPQSVLARWERLLSRAAKGELDFTTEDSEGTAERHRIQALDPFFPVGGAYSKQAFRKVFLRYWMRNNLASSSTYFEFLRRYADTALLLGEYGPAASLYWKSSMVAEESNEASNQLSRFLYCLNQLGHPEIQQVFVPQLSQEFEAIDAFIFNTMHAPLPEREPDMPESPHRTRSGPRWRNR